MHLRSACNRRSTNALDDDDDDVDDEYVDWYLADEFENVSNGEDGNEQQQKFAHHFGRPVDLVTVVDDWMLTNTRNAHRNASCSNFTLTTIRKTAHNSCIHPHILLPGFHSSASVSVTVYVMVSALPFRSAVAVSVYRKNRTRSYLNA